MEARERLISAASLRDNLIAFSQTLQAPNAADSELKQALEEVAGKLQERFDLRSVRYHAQNRKRKTPMVRCLQVQRAYFKRKALKLEQQIREYRSEKMQGRLQTSWILRTGLADPTVPARTLQDWCREFGEEESSAISHSSIAAARDCFCELVKECSGRALRQAVDKLPAALACPRPTSSRSLTRAAPW